MIENNLKISETTIRVGKLLLEFINNPMDFDDMFNFYCILEFVV